MKESIYKDCLERLPNFENEQKAIDYYMKVLKDNPESSEYPKELREFYKGLIIGLKGSIELKKIK